MNHTDLQKNILSNFTELFKIIKDYDTRLTESEKIIKKLQVNFKNINSNNKTGKTNILDSDNDNDNDNDNDSESETDSDSESESDNESVKESVKEYTEEILKKKKIPELKLICKNKGISSNRKNKQTLIDSILGKTGLY